MSKQRVFRFRLWPFALDYTSTPSTDPDGPSVVSICPGCQVDLCEDCSDEIDAALLVDIDDEEDDEDEEGSGIDWDAPGWDDL